MSNTDLVRIGLMAAQRLGAPADARIVFVGRGDRVMIPIPESRRKRAPVGRPTEEGSPPDLEETRGRYERIDLGLCVVLDLRFAAGYSKAANTLAINLRP